MEINKSFNICNIQNTHGYYNFFENIVKSTIFKKIIKDKDSEENKNNIIYNNKSFIIIYENPILEKMCSLFAITDPNDINRFFVGINISIGISSYALTGLFLYFDNDKVVDMVIIPEILKICDSIISDNDIYLYNQTIVILYKNRTLNVYRINVNCFNYYDKLLGKHTDYTDIIGTHKIYNNRWIVFSDNNVLDLGSVKVEFNKLYYNMYNIINNCELFLTDTVDTIVEEPYNDNYPKNCPKCNQYTSIAKLFNKINHNINQITSLGNSYCHNCFIRYSLSKKKWICCKLFDNSYCFSDLDSYYICHNNHNNNIAYIMNYSGKKPYRNEYELFIIK